MAQKRKAAMIDDCQRTLEVRPTNDSASTMTVHVPEVLTRGNRRHYEQCRAYDVRIKAAGIAANSEHNYEVYTLSNAWWVKRSIEMAKGVYLEATKKERALLGDGVGKYNEFFIFASGGAATNIADLFQYDPASSGDDMDAAAVTADESLYRTVVTALKDDAGDKMGFTILDEDLTGDGVFNIFNQYLLSRNITPDADTRTGPYADLFTVDEDTMDSLQQDGDLTPFDADAFPNPFVLADTIYQDQGIPSGGQRYSKTITAPLGVVIIKKFNSSGTENNFATTDQFLLEVKKGGYKGVHAPAYKAMSGPHRGLA